jgi:uncharacterized protein YfaP (DUF2135 family)
MIMAEFQFHVTGLAKHASRRLRRLTKPALPLSVPFVGVLFLVAVTYSVQNPGEIRITAPRSGSVTDQTFVDVAGTVGNARVEEIRLVVNGLARTVAVKGGQFLSRVPLFQGENTIQAMASGAIANLTSGSELVDVTAKIPRFAIWTELTWEGPGDIDLHLYLPNGEHCYYRQKKTPSGAWLDIDNTTRDGPEHIIMEKALPGTYRMSVLYFAAKEGPPRTVPWRLTVRLKEGQIQRTYSGTLTFVNEERIIDTFSFP